MLDRICSLIRDNERFFVVTHIRPDGDALGSQIALGHFLKALGKEVTLLNSDDPPPNLEWMPGIDAVETFDGSVAYHEALNDADVVFVVDANDADRLGRLGPIVEAGAADTVLIDHHQAPDTWFTVSYVRSEAAATGEMIYDIIAAYDADRIDATIATALYTAIMTDTGSFRFTSVTPRIHRIIADVLERGSIQPAPIHEQIYDRKSMPALRLLGLMLNRIRLRYDGQVAYSILTQRMVDDAGASWNDKDGFVNYLLSIDGVRAALLFSEVNDGAKISFRSEAGTRVDEWARSFDGGGHKNAAGAYVRRPSLKEVVDHVLDAAPRFLDLAPEAATHNMLSAEDEDYLRTLMDAQHEDA